MEKFKMIYKALDIVFFALLELDNEFGLAQKYVESYSFCLLSLLKIALFSFLEPWIYYARWEWFDSLSKIVCFPDRSQWLRDYRLIVAH